MVSGEPSSTDIPEELKDIRMILQIIRISLYRMVKRRGKAYDFPSDRTYRPEKFLLQYHYMLQRVRSGDSGGGCTG